jgi:transcriptional regulator with XRE-family HTH domain
MSRDEVATLVQKVLKEGPFAMRQLAEDAGVSYGVLRGWAIGRRTPTPENLRKLAHGFERRAGHLQNIAEELRRAAEAE